MRNQFLILILLLLSMSVAFGGNKKHYAVADIPPQLLTNAKAVLRSKTVVYQRKDINSATEKIKYAVTVLNKGGDELGFFAQPYYKFSRVSAISAVVYDKNGKKVKSIPGSEILDVAIDGWTSLYSDQRIKLINPEYDDYPFTVEYSCTISYHGILNIPSWQVYPSYDMSIQEETFTLTTPETPDDHGDLGVQYYSNDSLLVVEKSSNKDGTNYRLHVENLLAMRREDFTWSIGYVTPSVHFAPVTFSISGFEGSFNSWEAFGGFENQLIQGRDALSEETVAKIKALVSNDTSQREKVETLYHYMQNKVRYVSVQKGIGGWQPIEAEKVDALSYGDCKALTNYMKGLLKVVGIKSDYTLVYAGSDAEPIISDFPSNQFNHAILCVPLARDTIWLECTSQQAPCGYLGTFTDDRDVLAVDDSGVATLLHTPAYGHEVNTKDRFTTVNVDASGNCDVHIKTKHSGMFYDENLPLYLDTRDNQKKKLLKQIHLSTITLKDFNFVEDKKSFPPVIHTEVALEARGYATKSGNRLLLTPYLFSKENAAHFRHKKRHAPIVIRRSYTTTDTVVYHLPAGYVAANFADKTIAGRFGNYHVSVAREPGKITYVRTLRVNKGTYPSSDWEQFTAFLEKLDKADKTKMVLMKVR